MFWIGNFILDVRVWPLQYRASYFLWLFYGKFSMILSDFYIHGVSKATRGRIKMNAFCCIVAGRSTTCVVDHCNIGIRIVCGYFMVNFRWFWAIFAPMAWAKQHRERQKWTRFHAFSHVGGRHMFFAIATPGFVCFGAHLTSDWSAFWVNFARFLALVRKPIQGIWMVHEAVQKLQFSSLFHAFLTRKNQAQTSVW